MAAKITLDEKSLEQLQNAGELLVEDSHGIPLVLMTTAARDRLRPTVYDDSDLTEAELKAQGAELLADPEEWGAPDMDVYDTMEGIEPSEHGS